MPKPGRALGYIDEADRNREKNRIFSEPKLVKIYKMKFVVFVFSFVFRPEKTLGWICVSMLNTEGGDEEECSTIRWLDSPPHPSFDDLHMYCFHNTSKQKTMCFIYENMNYELLSFK